MEMLGLTPLDLGRSIPFKALHLVLKISKYMLLLDHAHIMYIILRLFWLLLKN